MIKAKVDFGNDGVVVEVVMSKDGNQWCCLAGDNLQEGVAGFGYTPQSAVSDFMVNFRNDN